MEFKTTKIGMQPEIRKRVTDGDITIPLDIDFADVNDTDNGEKIVKAGTPISKAGKAANDATAYGILLTDVRESRPVGTVVTHGSINEAVAKEWSGVTVADEAKTALKLVVFE